MAAVKKQRCSSDEDAKLAARLLDVIEKDIFPKTEVAVGKGNKVFGAAILEDKPGLPVVLAETNHEMLSPLYHGEVYCIKQWSETLSEKPSPQDSVFLSTHEPCCMCISAICWSGFKKVYYFFPYETTRDQGIPHDLNIMHKLWGVESYKKTNELLTSIGLHELVGRLAPEERVPLEERMKVLTERYAELAKKYHSEKETNPCNKLSFK
eukprot:TRINITY_DN19659_c0_g1_i1.p1 TRINITY_DN19659_c0_g1~~TRINITY_DN19659_c0_g1_i1.p1  ORF type:complete len:231 (+),score=34.87 TRINITY_DN19659_c0_g1_i1:67-693(+)